MAQAIIKKTFWETQTEAFQSLMKAMKKDAEAKKIASEGDLSIDKGKNVKDWFKQNWTIALLWGILVLVIIKMMQADEKPAYKKGHHGINRYGERY